MVPRRRRRDQSSRPGPLASPAPAPIQAMTSASHRLRTTRETNSMIRQTVVSASSLPFVILLGLLVAAVVSAQAPARDQPRMPRPRTGVIRGRVVRADTGEPLRRVQVRAD